MSGKIAVVGAGAWGTALAANQALCGKPVTMWGRDEVQIESVVDSRENEKYLPGIMLPTSLNATNSLPDCVDGASIILLAVPAQQMADTVGRIVPMIPRSTVLVSCAKGIEAATGHTMTQIISRLHGASSTAALSGPSFAVDVVSGLPTAVTVAAGTTQSALSLCGELSNKQLRCYASDDLAGVDYGGALKNVLAIAAGIVQGKGLGASALAAVTTRGFAELQRIAITLGAKPETLSGLSGLGDLILTCASEKSRNFAYGSVLGKGGSTAGLKLAEGVATAAIAAQIAQENHISAPLIDATANLLSGNANLEATIAQLLSRPLKVESVHG